MSKHSAILFTDITKSSKLWKKSQKGMLKALRKHDSRIRRTATNNKGLIIKAMGDSFMIHFNNPKNAIQFSFDIQNSFKNKPIRIGKEKMEIRIGIGVGPMKKKKILIQGCKLADYFGETVNIASRMETKVSPPNGFGIYFKGNKIPITIRKMIKTNEGKIKTIHFKKRCPSPSKQKMLAPECRLSSSLFGVGELTAFSVKI